MPLVLDNLADCPAHRQVTTPRSILGHFGPAAPECPARRAGYLPLLLPMLDLSTDPLIISTTPPLYILFSGDLSRRGSPGVR